MLTYVTSVNPLPLRTRFLRAWQKFVRRVKNYGRPVPNLE